MGAGVEETRQEASRALVIGPGLPIAWPGSFNEVIQDVSRRANTYLGSTAQRDALPPTALWLGVEFKSTTDGRTYAWTGTAWVRKYRRSAQSGGGGSTTIVPPGFDAIGGGFVGSMSLGSFAVSGLASVGFVFAKVALWAPLDTVYGGAILITLDGTEQDRIEWNTQGHGGWAPGTVIATTVDIPSGAHTVGATLVLANGSAGGMEVHQPRIHLTTSLT